MSEQKVCPIKQAAVIIARGQLNPSDGLATDEKCIGAKMSVTVDELTRTLCGLKVAANVQEDMAHLEASVPHG